MIVRTAAQGAKKDDFVREIAYLHRLNEVRRASGPRRPRSARWSSRRPTSRSASSATSWSRSSRARSSTTPKQHDRVTSFLQRTAPELVERVELYEGKKPLLEKWDVDKAFDSTLSRRVDLPSGGYLIIDYAEALTVIDVNTGSFTGRGKGRLEDTITKVNVEAAEEVVRQLRHARHRRHHRHRLHRHGAGAQPRQGAEDAAQRRSTRTSTKTYVVEVSPLGLVEMTRQNVTDGVREILTKRCPTCDGEGVVASEETVAISIVAQARRRSSTRTRSRRPT